MVYCSAQFSSGIIVFEAQSGSAWSSARSSADFEAGQYSSIRGQTSSMQLSSADFKTNQYSSIGVQTSSIRLNAAPCNSAQLNAAQYSSVQHNPTWKVLNTPMFWTVRALRWISKISWNSLKLNSEKLSVSSARIWLNCINARGDAEPWAKRRASASEDEH